MDDNPSFLLRGIGTAVGSLLLLVLAAVLIAVVSVPAIVAGTATVRSTVGVFDSLPDSIQINQQPQQNRIFALSGTDTVQIATIFSQNREEVAWGEVSAFAKDAAVSGEDRRFFEHGGIDIPGIARAAVKNVAGGKISQGASTITQQYVKNTFIQAALEEPDEASRTIAYNAAIDDTFERKLREMKLAISLEKHYSKQDILLAYLNIANYGGQTYGIEAAARRYFNTSALELTAAQAASLVAIVQSPGVLSLSDPTHYAANLERRDVILNAMLLDGKLTQEQHTEAITTPLDATTVTVTEPANGCFFANDHTRFFCDYVTKLIKDLPALGPDAASREANFRHGGYDIYTTLDLGVQIPSQDAVWANAPKDATALQLGSAAVSIEVGTGRILAMAQNKDYNNTQEGGGPTATAVNFSTDKDYGGSSGFQPGSTYKIFTLLNWLQNDHGINEVVDGSPRSEAQGKFSDTCNGRPSGPAFTFKNDDSTSGPMTVARATQLSVNGAFVSMALQLDLCAIRKTAESIGVHRADAGPLGETPASVLGTNEIAPMTMAASYAAIASGGIYCAPIAVDRIVGPDGAELPGQAPNCTQQLEPDVANTAAYAMTKVVSAGTAQRSNPGDGVQYIGKTGTTDSSTHTWVVGASTEVATAVWVGNISGFYPIRSYANTRGIAGGYIRHDIFRTIAQAVDRIPAHRGVAFPQPAARLLTGSGVTIPDVTGLSPDAATAKLRASGFTTTVGNTVDSDRPAGAVATTRPVAGTLAPKNSAVVLNTSNGALAAISMPNVIGNGFTSSETAHNALAAAGFTTVTDSCITIPEDKADRIGSVIATVPTPGTTLQRTDPITLSIGAEGC